METVIKIAVSFGTAIREFEVLSFHEVMSGNPIEPREIHHRDSVVVVVRDPSGFSSKMEMVIGGDTLKNSVVSIGTFN